MEKTFTSSSTSAFSESTARLAFNNACFEPLLRISEVLAIKKCSSSLATSSVGSLRSGSVAMNTKLQALASGSLIEAEAICFKLTNSSATTKRNSTKGSVTFKQPCGSSFVYSLCAHSYFSLRWWYRAYQHLRLSLGSGHTTPLGTHLEWNNSGMGMPCSMKSVEAALCVPRPVELSCGTGVMVWRSKKLPNRPPVR